MNNSFSYIKNNISSFEKSEDSMNQIKASVLNNHDVLIQQEQQIGYNDERWIEKSNSVKAHDNYTCQLCHAFNPSLCEFVFVKQGKYETLHRYYWAGDSFYEISVRGLFLTVTFHFYSGFHLAMPRLNVHHKVYYKNRNLWDYDDDCLVTLCEDCHHYVHSKVGIPILEIGEEGNLNIVGETATKPYVRKLDHTDLGSFRPFALVKENMWGDGLSGQELINFKLSKEKGIQWYDSQKVLDEHVVHIGYFTCYDKRWNKHSPEEMKNVAEFIILDFIENFLGFKYNR